MRAYERAQKFSLNLPSPLHLAAKSTGLVSDPPSPRLHRRRGPAFATRTRIRSSQEAQRSEGECDEAARVGRKGARLTVFHSAPRAQIFCARSNRVCYTACAILKVTAQMRAVDLSPMAHRQRTRASMEVAPTRSPRAVRYTTNHVYMMYLNALRRWSPRRYIRAIFGDRLDLEEWEVVLRSIEDKRLLKKAHRMDLSLDDLPLPEYIHDPDSPYEISGYWVCYKPLALRLLEHDTHRALLKIMRDRAPVYRKERREIQEFYLKLVLGIGSAITGIGGTFIGIIALLKK